MAQTKSENRIKIDSMKENFEAYKTYIELAQTDWRLEDWKDQTQELIQLAGELMDSLDEAITTTDVCYPVIALLTAHVRPGETTPYQTLNRIIGERNTYFHKSQKMSVQEAGRRGGYTTVERYGDEFYEVIGSKGGRKTSEKYGTEFFQEIGKKGAEARKRKRLEEQGLDADL